MSCDPDFVVMVQLPHMEAYQSLVQRLFTSDASVRNVKTRSSGKCAKFEPAISLPGRPRTYRRRTPVRALAAPG